jgi:Cell shape-determining protein
MSAFTTKKKGEKFNHTITFKIGDSGHAKLDQCLVLLGVDGKRTSDKMRLFIDKVAEMLTDYQDLSHLNRSLKSQITRYKRKFEHLKNHNDTPRPLQEIEKPEPPEKPEPEPELTHRPETTFSQPPSFCIRNISFKMATDNSFCLETCKQTHPTEFQACQELQKEKS